MTTKKTILINPPPRLLSCVRCGRSFDELPIYENSKEIKKIKPVGSPDYVVDKEKNIRLMKTFRDNGNGQVSASWECQDCIVGADLREIVEHFIDNDEELTFYDWFRELKLKFKIAKGNKERVFEYESSKLSVKIVENWIDTIDRFGIEIFKKNTHNND